MARGVRWGTPERTEHYLRPRRPHALLKVALGAGVVVLLALGVLALLGRRKPIAPGHLISAHALLEARCEECHAPGQGAADVRCQRCHDAAGGGRLTLAAHVLFGSGDPRQAAAAGAVACARCHVEHRGRGARLSAVSETQCVSCHFRRFAGHPEFALLRGKASESPGLNFPHKRHLEALQKEKRLAGDAACGECHERDATGRDFVPLDFDRHCAACHAASGSLGSGEPLPEEDALPPAAIQALGVEGAWLTRTAEFELGRGRVTKTALHHRDEWVLFNLRRLRRELAPDGYGAERAALLARLGGLERRLALSAPLAGLSADALAARKRGIEVELRGIDARLEAIKAPPTAGSATRLIEVEAAARAAGDASADALRQAAAVPPPGEGDPLRADELAGRKRELLTLLEAIESTDPALAGRAEDLRRRLLVLRAGETSEALLQRVRRQRATEVARVEDEQKLRAQGVPPPPEALLAGEQAAVRRALAEAQARLQELSLVPAPEGTLSDEVRGRKTESAQALAAPCAKCHPAGRVDVAPVKAARHVLVRSIFEHGPHLMQADCARCHPNVARSTAAADLNFPGVASCRQCHGTLGASQDCLSCHAFHPHETP